MLTWQKFGYKPTGGLDQFKDSLVLGDTNAIKVENYYADKLGSLRKRKGIRRWLDLSGTISGPKRISSGKDDLLVVDDHKLYSVDSGKVTTDRGLLSPSSLSVRQIDSVEDTQLHGLFARCTDSSGAQYNVVASVEGGYVGSAVTVTVEKDGSGLVLPKTTIGSCGWQYVAITSTGSPIQNGRYAIIAFITASDAVNFYRWDSDSPASAPVLIGTVTATVTALDVIGVTDGFAFAYSKGGTSYLTAKDHTFTDLWPTMTSTISEPLTGDQNSLGWDGQNNTIIWVRGYVYLTDWYVEFSTHKMVAGLTTDIATTLIHAAAGTPAFPFGIAPMAYGATTDKLVFPYGETYVDGTNLYKVYTTSTSSLAGPYYLCGYAIAKPWTHNGRFYCAVGTSQGGNDVSGLLYINDLNISTDVVFAVDIDAPAPWVYTGPIPITVAAWAVLAAPNNGGTGAIRPETYAVPTYLSNDKIAFSCTALTYKVLSEERLSTQIVELDYSFRPNAVKSVRGGSFLTGSLQTWYDGSRVQELGILNCPPANIDSSSGSETGPDTFIAQVGWTYQDALGVIHRSYTSAVYDKVLSNYLPTSVDIDPELNVWATMRDYIGQRMFVGAFAGKNSSRLYKQNSYDSSAYHALPTETTASIDVNAVIESGAEPYTLDGVDLPNIPFGGCRYAVMSGERLWVAALPRGQEAQYSDMIRPSSGAGQPFAPEFHPSLKVVNPLGDDLTGMGILQDKVVLFTENATYAIEGRGPDASGGNNDVSGLIPLSQDFGCTDPESVITFPGGVMFKSKQGMGLIDQNMGVTFVGNVVDETDGAEFRDACHFEEIRSILWLLDKGETGQVLVFNYVTRMWSTWELPVPLSSMCVHKGDLYFLGFDEFIYKYGESDADKFGDNDSYVGAKIRSPWYNLDETNSGWVSVRWVGVKGVRGTDSFKGTLTMYYNGDDGTVKSRAIPWSLISQAKAGQFDVLWDVPVKRCKLFSVEWSDEAHEAGKWGEHAIQSIDFELGRARGMYKTGVKL